MAAISRIEINTVQLNNDIKHLRTTLSQTRTHMESLRAKMDDMNNMWEGPTNLAMVPGRPRTNACALRFSGGFDSNPGIHSPVL